MRRVLQTGGRRADPDEPAASAWATGDTWGDLGCPACSPDGGPVSETDSDDSLQPYDLSEGSDEGDIPLHRLHAEQRACRRNRWPLTALSISTHDQ